MLSVDNNKDIVFDVNDALSFDGRTAPYIQNAHVRANSILRKAGGMPDFATFKHELASHEIELIDHSVPVIQAESAETQAARLRLVAAAKQVLANALRLLVIQAPDVM